LTVLKRFLALAVYLPFAFSAVLAQERTAPTAPHPPPQLTGRFIGTDGVRQIILEHKGKTGRATFIGTVQSTCMIPANSTSSGTTPLAVSGIPKGSQITVFYVRHLLKINGTQRVENIILAFRLDRANGDSPIPAGKMISCAGGTQNQTRK
jgi:hypothetical protein